MDIQSGTAAAGLSNFQPRPFTFRTFPVASMEGLVQALKHKSPEMQLHVMTLVGKAAKFKGKKKKWFRTQTLWWQGQEIDRHGEEYQKLLDEAFEALFFGNESAARALLATGDAILTHSIGKSDPSKTVLTEREFCSRLMRIRSELQRRAAKTKK
jgi:hypothetical protein